MPTEVPKPYKKLKLGNPIPKPFTPSYAEFVNQNPAVAATWDDTFPPPPPETITATFNPDKWQFLDGLGDTPIKNKNEAPLLELNLKAKKQDEWHKVTSIAGLKQFRAQGRALEFNNILGERLPLSAHIEYSNDILEKLLKQGIYVHSFLLTRVCCIVKRLHKITGEVVFSRWHGPSIESAIQYRETVGPNFLEWIGPMVSFSYNEETDILNV